MIFWNLKCYDDDFSHSQTRKHSIGVNNERDFKCKLTHPEYSHILSIAVHEFSSRAAFFTKLTSLFQAEFRIIQTYVIHKP